MSTTTKRARLSVACITLTAALLCSACSSQKEVVPQLTETIEVAPATVAVTRGDVFSMDTRRATIVPEAYELSFPISGNFDEMYVKLGDTVSEGELLMKLDDSAIADRIESLAEDIESLESSYAASNRKIQIKIEKANLELQELLDAQAAATTHEVEEPVSSAETTEDSASSAESAADPSSEIGSSETSSSEDPSSEEENTSTESSESSPEESTSSEESSESSEESAPPAVTVPAVDPYDIELKRLEIRGYELELSQAKESQAQILKEKYAQMDDYKLQQADYYLYSPIDGQLVWATASADMLSDAGPRISAETLVALVVDPTKINLQTERLEKFNFDIDKCDRIFAVINGKEYDLTPLEPDTKADAQRAMEGKTLYTKFAADTTDDISHAGTAVICFQYNTAENALTLPNGCTFYDIGYYVYRVNGDEREKVYIEIGKEGATCFEVISGLEEGDLIYAKS